MTRLTGIFLILISGCGKTVENPNIDEISIPEDIIWRVDSLEIPICKLCDELQMKLNILYNQEVNIDDRLFMINKKLLHVSIDGDTLTIENYTISNNNLEIYGSDWVDYAKIVSQTDTSLILRKTQRIIHEQGTEPPPNDLTIYLTKVK